MAEKIDNRDAIAEELARLLTAETGVTWIVRRRQDADWGLMPPEVIPEAEAGKGGRVEKGLDLGNAAWNEKDRFSVGGFWPMISDGKTCYPQDRHWNPEAEQIAARGIKLARSRDPKSASKDIMRRYWPAYAATWKELNGQAAREKKSVANLEATAKRFEEHGLRRYGQPALRRIELTARNGEGVDCDVALSLGDSAELKIRCSPDDALKVIHLLKTLKKIEVPATVAGQGE